MNMLSLYFAVMEVDWWPCLVNISTNYCFLPVSRKNYNAFLNQYLDRMFKASVQPGLCRGMLDDMESE